MGTLLKEKNLRMIYKESRAIPLSNFNLFFPFIIGIIIFIFLIYGDISIEESYDKIESLVDVC
jgi:ABC-type transport system involved in cytochrome c biogenesis permease subunit